VLDQVEDCLDVGMRMTVTTVECRGNGVEGVPHTSRGITVSLTSWTGLCGSRRTYHLSFCLDLFISV